MNVDYLNLPFTLYVGGFFYIKSEFRCEVKYRNIDSCIILLLKNSSD